MPTCGSFPARNITPSPCWRMSHNLPGPRAHLVRIQPRACSPSAVFRYTAFKVSLSTFPQQAPAGHKRLVLAHPNATSSRCSDSHRCWSSEQPWKAFTHVALMWKRPVMDIRKRRCSRHGRTRHCHLVHLHCDRRPIWHAKVRRQIRTIGNVDGETVTAQPLRDMIDDLFAGTVYGKSSDGT